MGNDALKINRIRSGLKILEGGKGPFGLYALFGQSNFQRINESYRGQHVQNRKDDRTGELYLYDTRLKKKTNQKLINQEIFTKFTGSKIPYTELAHQSITNQIALKKNVGNLEDGISFNDIAYLVKKRFGDEPVYSSTGELLKSKLEHKTEKEILDLEKEQERLRVKLSQNASPGEQINSNAESLKALGIAPYVPPARSLPTGSLDAILNPERTNTLKELQGVNNE